MGKKDRILELERTIKHLNKYGSVADEMADYIKELAEMPEDAVLIYRISGQTITHQIGMSARILFAKIKAEA